MAKRNRASASDTTSNAAVTAARDPGNAWGETLRGAHGDGASAPLGPHRGKGPKGYTRSDERIREDVSDQLMDHDRIDASDVLVQVKDGEVTLTGSVQDRKVKHLIEDVADGVIGVRDVSNQIRVRRDSVG